MNKIHVPFKESLKSTPEAFGIRVNEGPEYDVIFTEGNFEVRHYYKQLIAKVSMHGVTFDEFRKVAFGKLADYIFQGNAEGKKIPMTSPAMEQHGDGEKKTGQIAITAPLLQQQNDSGGWTMSFILPKHYSLQNAPRPIESSVTLHERELAEWLNKQPNLQSTEKYMVAQFDAPFTIPFMKKNEIQVKVDNMH